MLETACPKPHTKRLEGRAYTAFKRHVHELDGWQCRMCGRDVTPGHMDELENHHIQGRGQGRIDEPWNCVSVCPSGRGNRCHRLLTEKKAHIEFTDPEKRTVRVYLEPEIKLMKELDEARLMVEALEKENADLRHRLSGSMEHNLVAIFVLIFSWFKNRNAEAIRRLKESLYVE